MFYHIFEHNTYRFPCMINEDIPDPYQCPGQITGYCALRRWCHCDTQANLIQKTDTTEMKNVNTKRKTESEDIQGMAINIGRTP